MSRTIYTIDVTKPVPVLDITNGTDLDNEYYRFCADNVTDETGRFLEDSELTYNDFEIHPDEILPAGTKVVMGYLWGYDPENGMTKPTDYEVTLDKDASLRRAVYVLLSSYHANMSSLGEGGGGRFYFIEATTLVDDGIVEICYGT